MATITGLTAARMIEIEQASVIDGDVVGNDLILTTKGGSQINAGNVRGPQGVQGPVGSDLSVVSSKQILDVGISGQIRAGRQLTATDFTNMGLSAPIGLWNLSNLNDSSGNGRNLTNKGGVPFSSGIEGVASSAALFSGSTAQALYIADIGASDPFKLKTGSVGCWFRTAKRGAYQTLISKGSNPDGQSIFWLQIISTNVMEFSGTHTGVIGALPSCITTSDVCDDRWHFAVGVCDGSTMRIYVDGILEGMTIIPSVLFSGNAPFNIGSLYANAGVSAGNPNFGRIDEAFVTADILSEEQIRNLYCVKVPHTLSAVPTRISLNVRRKKKGAALASGDFPTQPLRLYNFSAGSLGDEGSNGQTLTNVASAISVPGADGSLGNAYNFISASAQYLTATDAGLPAGLSAKSYGWWFKIQNISGTQVMFAYGTYTGNLCIVTYVQNGQLLAVCGSDTIYGPALVSDGTWHFITIVEDNGAVDGLKRKVYLDGRVVATSTGLSSITLAGAAKFHVGSHVDNSSPFNGQIDTVFVCGYALDAAQIAALYAKGSLALGASPKGPADHIELMTSTDLFCAFDTLGSQELIDLVVA